MPPDSPANTTLGSNEFNSIHNLSLFNRTYSPYDNPLNYYDEIIKHTGEKNRMEHDIKYKNNPPSPPTKPSGSIEGKIMSCPFKQGEVINATHEWKKLEVI